MTHATSGPTLGLRTVPSAPRQTPPSGAQRFHDALAAASSALVGTVESVASLVPGARTVATAVRGALSTAGSSESSRGFRAASPPNAAAGVGAAPTGADEAMSLLALQQQIGLEQQRFQTASNVLKARHDTAKAVISNVR